MPHVCVPDADLLHPHVALCLPAPALPSHSLQPPPPVPVAAGSPSSSMDVDGSEAPRPSAAPTAGPSTSVAPGATLSAGSAAFDMEDEDMGVLLKVETLQDKVAFWTTAYYQVGPGMEGWGACVCISGPGRAREGLQVW